MMRSLIWILVLFGLAVLIALAPQFNAGNVALLWPPYRVDISSNLFLIGLLAICVVFHLVMLLFGTATGLPGRVRMFRSRRRDAGAAKALQQSLVAHFEGRFGRAQRMAEKAGRAESTAGLAALIGARAAHRMRQYDRAQEWLAKAANDSSIEQAQLMTRAELAVDQREAHTALAAIEQMQAGGARHIHALRIALRAHELAKDWPKVLKIAKLLDKREALHPVVSQRLRIDAYKSLFAVRSGDPVELKRLWSGVSSDDRVQADIALAAADAFASAGQQDAARRILENALDSQWSSTLIDRYASMSTIDPSDRLARAERWRERYGNEPGLLRALGELCAAEKLWGKAQEYLLESLHLQDSADTHLALARLYEITGRSDEAATHYRLGAQAGNVLMLPDADVPPARPALTETVLPKLTVSGGGSSVQQTV